MKKEKIIAIIIGILIISIFILISMILNLKTNKNDITNNIENEKIDENNNTNVFNDIDYNNSEYIFENEAETGTVSYDDSQLNNFEFELVNIPEEILQVIEDTDEFNKIVKRYIYTNGLVDATKGQYTQYTYNDVDNIIDIVVKLNNQKSNTLLISLYLDENQVNIEKY